MANKSPGLNGLCPKKSLSLVVISLMFLFSFANVSALGFDNVKDVIDTKGKGFDVGNKKLGYNPIWKTYSPIEIKNFFGYGKTLFRGAITQHDFSCGQECSSTMQIHLTEDSVLIDDVDFYTIKDDGSQIKQNIRGYQFYSNGVSYSLGTEVSAGTYEVRLDGQKKSSRTVDWVIKTQGETLEEFAVWGGISILTEPIISHYALERTSGDVIDSKKNYNMNNINATRGVSGKINDAFSFDGDDWLYNLSHVDPDDYNNGLSISGWIYPTSVLGSSTGRRSPFGFDSDGGWGAVELFVENDSNMAMLFGCGLEACWHKDIDAQIYINNWYFVTMVHNATHDLLYVNGTLVDTFTSGTLANNANDFYIGSDTDSNSSGWVGTLDEITIWDQIGGLTQENITVLYNSNTGVITPSGEVTLNSPIDDYLSSSANITFNCSAEVAGATLINISLWHNATGTWVSNQTRSLTGDGNLTTFNLTLDDGEYIDWTCSAADSDNDRGFGENWTVGIDISLPVINITYPDTVWDYGREGNNITLNWTVSDDNLESCWFEYNNTNISVTCTDENATFILDSQSNITFYVNDSVGHEANYTRSWIYKLFGNSESYNSTSYETATEGFRINITATGSQTVLANLSYNGTIYPGTKTGNGTYMEFYKDFGGLPEIATATAINHTFFWEVWYGTQNINTTENNQSVGRTVFGLCNATLTTPYINFTFEDEETAIATNATIDSSTWYYWIGDGTANKSLLYSTTTANESYGFCFTPTDKTMENTITLQYSFDPVGDIHYPQRRWTSTTDLTNTTTNQKLYMLETTDGTYSIYQVQTATGSSLEGVKVQAERKFSGAWVLVEEGTTDSAGGFTAWLNPDYDHRLTFTKSGYVSQQVTVRPSSSTYTIVMSGGEEAATYNSSMEGLSWKIYPGLGKLLLPNTTQIFLFNITANLSNIVSCKMELINNNSVSLGTTTGCDSKGGNLSLSIPLGTNRSVRGIYSVNIGDGYFVVDADAYWIVMETNIPERGTIVAFFKYARNLNEFGSDDNRQEYSRIVFFFLMLSIIMGSICYSTGWDFSTGGGAMVFLTFIIIMASYSGFLTLSYTGEPGNAWMDRHVVALITSLFTAGFVLNKMAREA